MKPLGMQTAQMGVRWDTACVHQKYKHKEGGERSFLLKKGSREEKSKYVAFDKGNLKKIIKQEQRGRDMTIQQNFNSRHASLERTDQKNRFS